MARARPQPKSGRVQYLICGPKGMIDAARVEASHALVRAQRIAEFWPGKVELRVMADYVLGPSKLLYRVVRDGDGIVFTHVVSLED